jgi:hypothetical protein
VKTNFQVKVEFMEDEATGKKCPMCEDEVYLNARQATHPLQVTFEDESGALKQRTFQQGICASCADMLKDMLPPVEGNIIP